jgi:hypothetical protein
MRALGPETYPLAQGVEVEHGAGIDRLCDTVRAVLLETGEQREGEQVEEQEMERTARLSLLEPEFEPPPPPDSTPFGSEAPKM